MGQRMVFRQKDLDLYEKASKKLLAKIDVLKAYMVEGVKIFEAVREAAIEEGFNEQETKTIIAIACNKLELNSVTKKAYVRLLYPADNSNVDFGKFNSKTREEFNNPRSAERIADKDLYEGDYDLVITNELIDKRLWMKVARLLESKVVIRVRNGLACNIRVDNDDWLIKDGIEEIAEFEAVPQEIPI